MNDKIEAFHKNVQDRVEQKLDFPSSFNLTSKIIDGLVKSEMQLTIDHIAAVWSFPFDDGKDYRSEPTRSISLSIHLEQEDRLGIVYNWGTTLF